MQPAPAAWTTVGGKSLKVHHAALGGEAASARPGTVVRADRQGLEVATGAGVLQLLEVQLEGKRRMDVAAFVAGHRMETGSRLGDTAPAPT